MKRLLLLPITLLVMLAAVGTRSGVVYAVDPPPQQVNLNVSLIPVSGNALAELGVTINGLDTSMPFYSYVRSNTSADWTLILTGTPQPQPTPQPPAFHLDYANTHVSLDLVPVVDESGNGRIQMRFIPQRDFPQLLPANPAGFYHIAVCQTACTDNLYRIAGGNVPIAPGGNSILNREVCAAEQWFAQSYAIIRDRLELPLIPGAQQVIQLGFDPLDPNLAKGCGVGPLVG